MIKYRFYLDKDAETAWLNQMAADGWAMKRFFAGFYDFETCENGEYVYQVDFGADAGCGDRDRPDMGILGDP